MKTAALCACASLALAGCATGKLDNLLLTTLALDRAFVDATVGPFGLTLELRAADARELKAMAEKARMFDLLRAAGAN